MSIRCRDGLSSFDTSCMQKVLTLSGSMFGTVSLQCGFFDWHVPPCGEDVDASMTVETEAGMACNHTAAASADLCVRKRTTECILR